VEICKLTKNISFQIEGEVIGYCFFKWFFVYFVGLLVIGWRMNRFFSEMISNQLVPAYKINITIKITSRHHVAERTFSSRGENNYIEKMMKFRSINTFE
jgi:hypothetical protein